jgi:hypothetical protein
MGYGNNNQRAPNRVKTMPDDDYDVSKTDDGRVLIITETYAVSFLNGAWHRKIMFKPEEIREDFISVDNRAEAKRLHEEAVKALKL